MHPERFRPEFLPRLREMLIICVVEIIVRCFILLISTSSKLCKHLAGPPRQKWKLPQSTKAFVVSKIFSKRALT
jgi:hypothetical protein